MSTAPKIFSPDFRFFLHDPKKRGNNFYIKKTYINMPDKNLERNNEHRFKIKHQGRWVHTFMNKNTEKGNEMRPNSYQFRGRESSDMPAESRGFHRHLSNLALKKRRKKEN